MEKLEGRFVPVWHSSAMRVHDSAPPRDSNTGAIDLARETRRYEVRLVVSGVLVIIK